MSADRECKWACDPQCELCEADTYLAEQEAAMAEGWQ